eukprot:2163440-Amphidinium_carterae.2
MLLMTSAGQLLIAVFPTISSHAVRSTFGVASSYRQIIKAWCGDLHCASADSWPAPLQAVYTSTEYLCSQLKSF